MGTASTEGMFPLQPLRLSSGETAGRPTYRKPGRSERRVSGMGQASKVSDAARQPSRSEYATDAAVHAVGIALGFAGAATLLIVALPRGDATALAAVTIYSAGLLAMWICSGFYNLWRSCRRRELLRCSDQSAIFAMIAGTYTPFSLIYMDGLLSLAMTLIIWLVAALGIALRLLHPDRFERVAVALYLALGWVGLVTFGPLLSSMAPSTLILLAIGGVLYSAGVIFHLWQKLPYQAAIWHAFVLVAATCHYAAVLGSVAALNSAL